MNEASSAQLYSNAEVYTVDGAMPSAEAVLVVDGRIAAVGTHVACEASLPAGGERIDLGGAALLPGFIDTHLHPLMLFYFHMNLDLAGASSIADLQRRIAEAAADKKPDEWVVGLAFDEQELVEARLPTRHELDAASGGRPVIVVKHDGHNVIASTRAIELAKVDARTADPPGGVIDREPDGFPAGTFREDASALIKSKVPLPDPRELLVSARGTFRSLVACGITSVGAVMQTGAEGPASTEGRFELPLMQAILEQCPVNLFGLLVASEPDEVESARATPLHDPAAGHRVGAIKIFADGTFGACTAYMDEPYDDSPDTRGFFTMDPAEIYRRMLWANEAGLQVAVHAIGDAAVRDVIALYDRLLREHPRPDHRHRIEHASQLDVGIVADLARLGLVVSSQPLYIHSEKGWLHKRLGRRRARWTYPFRSLVAAGVPLAGASDAPVESVDVLHAIECCVTRDGFETAQCITAEQAVRMYTLDAAYAQHEDDEKGSITPGKRADMVVLSASPVSVPAGAIHEITVERTIVGGRVVYDRREEGADNAG